MSDELSPAEEPPLRVAVYGPDPLARGGLLALLREAGLREVGLGVAERDPDVILWDLGPGQPGRGEPPRIDADRPLLALVADREGARHALSRGASGVILRSAEAGRLVAAIRALVADLVVIDDTLAAGLLPELAPPASALSPREAEVLALLAEGLTNADIADELDLSAHTVRFHVRAVLARLKARNRAEAVARAVRMGLLRA